MTLPLSQIKIAHDTLTESRRMTRSGNDTRQRLMDAAHHMIWANSYGSVSVDDICAQAGVRKGSFYHFFPSKEELAITTMEEHWDRSRPELDRIFSAQVSPRERLSGFCQAAVFKQKEAMKSTGKVCGCPYATLGSELTEHEERLRAVVERCMLRLIRYFETTLRDLSAEGVIPPHGIPQKAAEMHAFFMGMLMAARIRNSLLNLENELLPGMCRIAGMTGEISIEPRDLTVQSRMLAALATA